MKKKGLIISTVVMVVVLIASLTTATYAWFTADSTTTITPIDFSVSAGSDVSIGLKTDNTYAETVTSGSFMSGTTVIADGFLTEGVPNGTIPTANTSYWNGTNNLGSSIDMQLDLSGMEKAVGTGKVGGSAATAALASLRTEATSTVDGMVKASGYGAAVTTTTTERAFAQRDYLDVVIGVQATATDLEKIFCNITINPRSDDRDLGMNAAIHVAWKIDGSLVDDADGNVDFYDKNTGDTQAADYHLGTTTASIAKTAVNGNTNTVPYGGTTSQVLNNGAKNLAITIDDAGTGNFISREKIYQIHLLIWIDGADEDCVQAAQGVGSQIFINFSASAPARANA